MDCEIGAPDNAATQTTAHGSIHFGQFSARFSASFLDHSWSDADANMFLPTSGGARHWLGTFKLLNEILFY